MIPVDFVVGRAPSLIIVRSGVVHVVVRLGHVNSRICGSSKPELCPQGMCMSMKWLMFVQLHAEVYVHRFVNPWLAIVAASLQTSSQVMNLSTTVSDLNRTDCIQLVVKHHQCCGHCAPQVPFILAVGNKGAVGYAGCLSHFHRC